MQPIQLKQNLISIQYPINRRIHKYLVMFGMQKPNLCISKPKSPWLRKLLDHNSLQTCYITILMIQKEGENLLICKLKI